MLDTARRINGVTYGCIALLLLIIMVGISYLDSLKLLPFDTKGPGAWIILLVAVVFLTYMVIITKQRANDITGRHALLVTLIGLFIPFAWAVLAFLPSEDRTNQYGAVPEPGFHPPFRDQ